MSIAKRLHAKHGKSETKLNRDELGVLLEFRKWESPSDAFKLSADPPRKKGKKR